MTKPLLPTLAAALALAVAAPARAVEHRGVDVTPLVGAWVALGDARSDFEDAPLAGFQLAYELDPHLALVGTFSWAPTRAKGLEDGALDLFQYDIGVRGQHAFALGGGATLRPFLGIGVGARTYHFDDSRYQGGTGFAWYAGGGAEVGYRALTAGVTVRHQLSTPDTVALDLSTPRNDLAIFASVGLRF